MNLWRETKNQKMMIKLKNMKKQQTQHKPNTCPNLNHDTWADPELRITTDYKINSGLLKF